jgi:hypothetical protein
LHGELADTGVYAGTLSITAFIARSEMAEALTASASDSDTASPTLGRPVVDPDDLAEHYWDMYTKRDGAEHIYPEMTGLTMRRLIRNLHLGPWGAGLEQA